MNNVNLNEYLLEGLGEIHALIAHEIHMFFKGFPQQLAFQRRSNTSFLIQHKTKGQIVVSYKYHIVKDLWVVKVNEKVHKIENGRSKKVSEISSEMIEIII
jgi:hypothetical protein